MASVVIRFYDEELCSNLITNFTSFPYTLISKIISLHLYLSAWCNSPLDSPSAPSRCAVSESAGFARKSFRFTDGMSWVEVRGCEVNMLGATPSALGSSIGLQIDFSCRQLLTDSKYPRTMRISNSRIEMRHMTFW